MVGKIAKLMPRNIECPLSVKGTLGTAGIRVRVARREVFCRDEALGGRTRVCVRRPAAERGPGCMNCLRQWPLIASPAAIAGGGA